MTHVRTEDEMGRTESWFEEAQQMRLWVTEVTATSEDFAEMLPQLASSIAEALKATDVELAGFRYYGNSGEPVLTIYTRSCLVGEAEKAVSDVLSSVLNDTPYGYLQEIDMEVAYPASEGWIHGEEPQDEGLYEEPDDFETLYLKRSSGWVTIRPEGYEAVSWEEELDGVPLRKVDPKGNDISVDEILEAVKEWGL